MMQQIAKPIMQRFLYKYFVKQVSYRSQLNAIRFSWLFCSRIRVNKQ